MVSDAAQRSINAASGVVPPTSRRAHSSTRPAPPLADASAAPCESMQDSNSGRHARSIQLDAGAIRPGPAGRASRRPAPSAHREELEHCIELADRVRQVALVDDVLEPVPLGLRIRRQLDADAQVAEGAVRPDPTRMFGSAPLSSAWPDGVPWIATSWSRKRCRSAASRIGPPAADDRAGLRALGGDVQPVAVPAIVHVGKLAAVDPDLEASELDRRRLDGCAG
jgi:hypothetical protein